VSQASHSPGCGFPEEDGGTWQRR